MSDDTTGAPRGRAVIAGAGGFVGQYLQRAFRDEGYEVVTVGRTGTRCGATRSASASSSTAPRSS